MSLLNDKQWVANFAKMLKNLPVEGVSMEVPMSVIIRDDAFNARLTKNESAGKDELEGSKSHNSTQQGATQLTDLALQIQRDGLLTPLTCRPDPKAPGRLSLVAGFRRHSALQLLKAENVKVFIKDMSEVQARITNMAENVSRRDLKPYEVAARCKQLRDEFNMPLKSIGAQLGFTQSYVSFLTAILEKGHPRLVRMWSEGKFPGVLTVDNLYKWASKLTSDEQISEFEDLRVVKGFDVDGNEVQESAEQKAKREAEKSKAPKRPSDATLKDALAEAESGNVKGVAKERMAGIIEAIRFMMGETPTLGGWYDPAAKKEAVEKREKALKAREKAKKAAEEAAKLESELS